MVCVTDVRDYQRVLSEVFAEQPQFKRSTWVAENVCLSPTRSPFAGPFSFATHAYAREPIDALDEDAVEQIVLLWATQLGKGDTTLAMLWSQCEVAPSPSMFAGTDQKYVQQQRDRFFAMGEASPNIKHLVPPANRRNLSSMDLGKMQIQLGWSGSPQTLSGRSVMLVVSSECDQWQTIVGQAPPQVLIEERIKAWKQLGAKLIWEGTPTDDESFMHTKYEASDQRQWHVPCPHCGKFQVLTHYPLQFGKAAGRGGITGIRDKHGNPLPLHEAKEAARYLCLDGCLWTNADRLSALPHGVWLPKGVYHKRITPKQTLAGKQIHVINGRRYELVGDAEQKTESVRGYHLNSLAAWSLSIGDNAVALLESERDPEKRVNFVNNWQAFKKRIARKLLKIDQFALQRELPYELGTVPPGVLFITLACDVQASQLFWAARGWGEGRSSWLIDRGAVGEYQAGLQEAEIKEQIAENLASLKALITTRIWPVNGKNPLGQTQLTARAVGIDTGFHPLPVQEWVYQTNREFKQRSIGIAVLALRGQQQMAAGKPYWSTDVDEDAKTRRIGGKMQVWQIATSIYKDDLRNHLWPIERHEPGAWCLPHNIREAGREYLEQVINEAPQTEIHKKTGRKKVVWSIVDKALGNHSWDCEVYNRALADMIVARNWHEVCRLLKPRAAAQQEREAFAAR